MAGEVYAICTAPLNKAALHAAGHRFPGHTELLAHLTGTDEVSMMLSTPKVKVIHVTTHIGLIDAIERIEPGLVERTIRRGHAALGPNPSIGVCAINPHAGENGLFGHGEEEKKIEPAIEALRAEGIDVDGPLPADTAFYLAGRGDYDLIVAMYHDQGHGPVKVLGIEAGVNITVGLPVIRTSVDHGTAFDIAGPGHRGPAQHGRGAAPGAAAGSSRPMIGKAGEPVSHIAQAYPDRVEVRGRDLTGDLMGRLTFTEYFHLLLTGDEPTADQRDFLDLLLISLAEHGMMPTNVAARMTLAADPGSLHGAVAAGILGCGPVILGTAEECAKLLLAGGDAHEIARRDHTRRRSSRLRPSRAQAAGPARRADPRARRRTRRLRRPRRFAAPEGRRRRGR